MSDDQARRIVDKLESINSNIGCASVMVTMLFVTLLLQIWFGGGIKITVNQPVQVEQRK